MTQPKKKTAPATFKGILAPGSKIMIRTVTMFQIGEVVGVTDKFIELKKASWIADTGRWHDCLKDGVLNEVEPFMDNVLVSIGAIVDVTPWRHSLDQKQK